MKKTMYTSMVLLIGMVIGLMVGSVSGAFATIGDRFEAIFAEYTILVDGVEQTLEASPVVINDSTYVHLRAMANMLGKDVTYKSDSRTIELNTPVLEALDVSGEGDRSVIADIDIGILDARISNKQLEIEQQEELIEQLKGFLVGANLDHIAYKANLENIEKAKVTLAELESQLSALRAQQ